MPEHDYEKELEELHTLSAPLIDWLREHYNPHTQIIVDVDRARVVMDLISAPRD